MMWRPKAQENDRFGAQPMALRYSFVRMRNRKVFGCLDPSQSNAAVLLGCIEEPSSRRPLTSCHFRASKPLVVLNGRSIVDRIVTRTHRRIVIRASCLVQDRVRFWGRRWRLEILKPLTISLLPRDVVRIQIDRISAR